MDAATMRDFCLGLPGAWPDSPWGEDHDVAKVGPGERGKIFAFFRADAVGVKCGSREVADEWLARYPEGATVMAYIGRNGWNNLSYDAIPDDELLDAVQTSYSLVVEGLPKKLRPEGWDALD
ncbi:MmcQ/YjbR family DNA-binding protein [Nocardioides sp. Kera G14]|uniref:MmcQ/YjbR family DNA-binding protein n=1 Tax=Nocardioides sp. Kera G14 TaxID=2884264 RepID=UPI001D123825|nr:MmcQ/YjbR family DNA-binding protein [Nocardioides sp. Kera G14]UDY24156.1 MmcQ/YjbR family DNA-binding protein [Nocardioides sp. Kera G14]